MPSGPMQRDPAVMRAAAYSSTLLYAATSQEHDVEIGTGSCDLHCKRADET
jgi:hypothetical protein